MESMMKKSLMVLSVLMICAFAGTGYAVSYVNGQKENVVITQETVYGDAGAAEGIWFRTGSYAGNGQLIWDTVVSASGEAETAFHYSGAGEQKYYSGLPASETERNCLILNSILGGGFFGGGFGTVEAYDQYGNRVSVQNTAEGAEAKSRMIALWAEDFVKTISRASDGDLYGETTPREVEIFASAVADVAARAPYNGEPYKENISLAELYDYYPIAFSIPSQLQAGNAYPYADGLYIEGSSYAVGDYLKVPFRKEDIAEITVTVDESGNPVSLSCSYSGTPAIESKTVVREDGYYFAFYLQTAKEGTVIREIGAGNGIFRIPVTRGENDQAILQLEQVEKVCALPEDCIVYDLYWEEGEEVLDMVVQEEGKWRIDRLWPESGDRKEGIPFSYEEGEEENGWEIRQISGGYILCYGTGSFVFFSQNEAGVYEAYVSGSFEAYRYPYAGERFSCQAAFREGRLAIAARPDPGQNSIRLYVFGKEGLLYEGIYHHSGDCGSEEQEAELSDAANAQTHRPGGLSSYTLPETLDRTLPWKNNGLEIGFET